jgi:anti-sigma-K factor RskA
VTPSSDCATLGELIGAYALDALEPEEAEAVAGHVASCPRCAQELDEHRDTVGLLAAAGVPAPAPPGVWDRIAGAIEGDTGPQDTPVLASLGARRAKRSRWTLPTRVTAAVAAAAAAALLGLQTARVDNLDHQMHVLSAAARQPGGFQGLAAALVDPSAQHLVLTSTRPGEKPLAQLVILPSGSAYLVGGRLAALPADSTYQLWSIIGGRAISVGLLGPHPTTVAFTVDPAAHARAYLVTVEPAGGVVAPTAPPIAKAAD